MDNQIKKQNLMQTVVIVFVKQGKVKVLQRKDTTKSPQNFCAHRNLSSQYTGSSPKSFKMKSVTKSN